MGLMCCRSVWTIEERGEQCTVVFASIVKKPPGKCVCVCVCVFFFGGDGRQPTPPLQLAGFFKTINAKKIVHCSQDSSRVWTFLSCFCKQIRKLNTRSRTTIISLVGICDLCAFRGLFNVEKTWVVGNGAGRTRGLAIGGWTRTWSLAHFAFMRLQGQF